MAKAFKETDKQKVTAKEIRDLFVAGLKHKNLTEEEMKDRIAMLEVMFPDQSSERTSESHSTQAKTENLTLTKRQEEHLNRCQSNLEETARMLRAVGQLIIPYGGDTGGTPFDVEEVCWGLGELVTDLSARVKHTAAQMGSRILREISEGRREPAKRFDEMWSTEEE